MGHQEGVSRHIYVRADQKNFAAETGCLAGMSNGATDATYKYNVDGQRTQKIVNGATTFYYLEDGQIAWQTDGMNTIHYVYDGNETPSTCCCTASSITKMT